MMPSIPISCHYHKYSFPQAVFTTASCLSLSPSSSSVFFLFLCLYTLILILFYDETLYVYFEKGQNVFVPT